MLSNGILKEYVIPISHNGSSHPAMDDYLGYAILYQDLADTDRFPGFRQLVPVCRQLYLLGHS